MQTTRQVEVEEEVEGVLGRGNIYKLCFFCKLIQSHLSFLQLLMSHIFHKS